MTEKPSNFQTWQEWDFLLLITLFAVVYGYAKVLVWKLGLFKSVLCSYGL